MSIMSRFDEALQELAVDKKEYKSLIKEGSKFLKGKKDISAYSEKLQQAWKVACNMTRRKK